MQTTTERRYVVWIERKEGRWKPTPAMPMKEAFAYADTLEREGKRTRVVQAPSFGLDDTE